MFYLVRKMCLYASRDLFLMLYIVPCACSNMWLSCPGITCVYHVLGLKCVPPSLLVSSTTTKLWFKFCSTSRCCFVLWALNLSKVWFRQNMWFSLSALNLVCLVWNSCSTWIRDSFHGRHNFIQFVARILSMGAKIVFEWS